MFCPQQHNFYCISPIYWSVSTPFSKFCHVLSKDIQRDLSTSINLYDPNEYHAVRLMNISFFPNLYNPNEYWFVKRQHIKVSTSHMVSRQRIGCQADKINLWVQYVIIHFPTKLVTITFTPHENWHIPP